MKQIITKIPIINAIARELYSYIRGNLIQSKKGKKYATIFTYKHNMINDRKFFITKINPQKSLYRDRLDELKKFYKKNTLQLVLHYILNGTPNTNYYRKGMLYSFEKIGTDKTNLKKAYEASAFMYSNRLMLRYHNYDIATKFTELAEKLSYDIKKIKVLDYGCGVADPSLFLALYGAKVTILDLDDIKFDFAISRFKKRNLKIKYKIAKQTEKPVYLGNDLLCGLKSTVSNKGH